MEDTEPADPVERRQLAAREYARRYRETHREQIIASKRAAYDPEKRREDYLRNRERYLASAKKWRENNPTAAAAARQRYKDKKKETVRDEVREAYEEDGRGEELPLELPPMSTLQRAPRDETI